MSKRHIAQTGKQAGQWVPCTAKNCRNGGTHITNQELRAARDWQLQKSGQATSLAAVPLTAVISYDSAPEAEKQAARDRVAAADKEKQRRRAEFEAERRAMQDRLNRAAEALPGVFAAKVKEDGKKLDRELASDAVDLMNSSILSRGIKAEPNETEGFKAASEKAENLASKLGLTDRRADAFKFAILMGNTHSRLMDKIEDGTNTSSPLGLGVEGALASSKIVTLGMRASSLYINYTPQMKEKFYAQVEDIVKFGEKQLSALEERKAHHEKVKARRKKQEDLKNRIVGLFVRSSK